MRAMVLPALLVASVAGAQPPALQIKLDRIEAAVGDRVRLDVIATGSSGSPVTGVDVAGLGEFLVESGPDVSMSLEVDMRRGVSRAVHTYRYTIVPRQAGSYIVGPATAFVGGQRVKSNAMPLRVLPRSQMAQPPDPQLFVQARADKTSVYLGEQVTVSYYLYARVGYYSIELRREPTTEGFWVEELEVPRGFHSFSQASIAGLPYRVQLVKRQALFPLRTGKGIVGPMVLDVGVGGGFFGGGSRLTRSSSPIEIEVRPLPTAGRPPGFREPNVGRFTLTGGVDRTQTTMGQAVKYRVQLDGWGNIKNVLLPELPQGQGYRRFDPEPKIALRIDNHRIAGTRVLEYLLSPSRPGHFTVPALSFHFFDPEAGQYRTATLPETRVVVVGAADAAAKAAPVGPLPGADPDLRGIREPAEVSAGGGSFFRGGLFWGLVAAPLLVYVLLVLGSRFLAFRSHLRLKGEPKRKAARAWKRLREADRLLAAGNADAFYGEIARVLVTFLEAKVGQPLGGLTLSELAATLLERGFPREVVDALVRELENCDFGRFAPRDSREEEMRGALRRSRDLLDALDRVRPLPPPGVAAAQEAP